MDTKRKGRGAAVEIGSGGSLWLTHRLLPRTARWYIGKPATGLFKMTTKSAYESSFVFVTDVCAPAASCMTPSAPPIPHSRVPL